MLGISWLTGVCDVACLQGQEHQQEQQQVSHVLPACERKPGSDSLSVLLNYKHWQQHSAAVDSYLNAMVAAVVFGARIKCAICAHAGASDNAVLAAIQGMLAKQDELILAGTILQRL